MQLSHRNSAVVTDRETQLRSLVSKAVSFLNKEYIPPTADELRALRKELKLTKEMASKKINISLRTWTTRESRSSLAQLREEEFAMVILFLLRGSRFWEQIQDNLDQEQADTSRAGRQGQVAHLAIAA